MLSIANLVAQQAQAQEQARLARMARAWDAYYGRLPKPLKVRANEPDDNVRLNYCRLIVDKGVSFLFGEEVGWEVGDEAADAWLEECWRANRALTTLQKIAINGAVCGHAWIKVQPGQPFPRIIVLDPATVAVDWDPHDYERVVRYTISWHGRDPATGQALAMRQLIEPSSGNSEPVSWRILDQESRGDRTSWETISDVTWPRPWAPILGCQNLPAPNEFFGIADLEDDEQEVNRAINFVVSNNSRILRYHAHPKTWGAGVATGKDLDVRPDGLTLFANPQAKLANLEMQSDLAANVEFYRVLKEALHEISRVPEIATGAVDRLGPLSGVALRVLYQSLIEKTQTKRRLYGDLLTDLCGRLLDLGGFGTMQKVTLHWPELLPLDPLAEAQTAVLWQQIGVSRATLLERAGFDPALEAEKSQEEAEVALETAARQFDQGGPPIQAVTGNGGNGLQPGRPGRQPLTNG